MEHSNHIANLAKVYEQYSLVPKCKNMGGYNVWYKRIKLSITVNSLLTDAPNSGLTRYSGHSSMHGLISLYYYTKKPPD